MKISSISTASYANKNAKPNFNGKWHTRQAYAMYDYNLYTIKNYEPDKNESVKDTIQAWKDETGYTPFEYVQKNNIYGGPNKDGIQYRYKDCPYIPVDLLKASVNYKLQNSEEKNLGDEINAAWLEKQSGNENGVKEKEKELVDIFKKEHGAKFKRNVAHTLNIYKEDFGNKLISREYHQ